MFRLDYWYNSVAGAFKPDGAKGICQYYKPDIEKIKKEIESNPIRFGVDVNDKMKVVRFDLGNIVFRYDEKPPMSLQNKHTEEDLEAFASSLGLPFDPKRDLAILASSLGLVFDSKQLVEY